MNERKLKINGDTWANLNYNLADKILKESFTNKKLNKPISDYDTIYHYTDLNGLIGIIESQTLFSTHINFLNDRKEFQHGLDLIESVLMEKDNVVHKRMLNELNKKVENLKNLEKYVTCFSRNGDLLSQWRSYGNQGKGVAIGFDPIEITESFEEILNGSNILYDEKDQKEIISEIIKISIEYFKEHKNYYDWEGCDYNFMISKAIIEFLESMIIGWKHPSFSEEKEFRLEYDVDYLSNRKSNKEILFRKSDRLLIPYIKLYSKYSKNKDESPEQIKHTDSDQKLPITKVILGPSLDFESNEMAIQMLLRKNGFNNVEIKASQIPYRI